MRSIPTSPRASLPPTPRYKSLASSEVALPLPLGLRASAPLTPHLLLPSADVGREAGTGVVKGVDDAEGASTGEAARGDVGHEELEELLVLIRLGKHGLDAVLESEVEGLGGEVPDDVGQVAAPEGFDALLGRDTGEAVNYASVALDLAGDNLRVGILGLDEELDTLDGRRARLGDGSVRGW